MVLRASALGQAAVSTPPPTATCVLTPAQGWAMGALERDRKPGMKSGCFIPDRSGTAA